MAMQFLINGIIAASLYSIVGLGVGVIYWESCFFNFACASILAFSGYFVWFIISKVDIPLILTVPFGIFLAILLNIALEIFVFLPMKKKSASSLVLLLASFGLYVLLQNIISFGFGDATKIIRPMDGWQSIDILGARMTSIQLWNLLSTIVLLSTTAVFLSITRTGLKIRAMASNSNLVTICGVDRGKVSIANVILSSLLLGSAGIMIAFDTDLTPTIGLIPLMMGVVVILIAGRLSVVGMVSGAALIAFLQQLSVWLFGGDWQDAVAFIILLIFLFVKPEGFLGKKIQKATL